MSFPLFASHIDGFSLSSCGEKICFKIESSKAYIGKMAGDYGFSEAKITLLDLSTKVEQVLITNDAFYDVRQKKLLIRNSGPADLMLDIKEQKLISYRR